MRVALCLSLSTMLACSTPRDPETSVAGEGGMGAAAGGAGGESASGGEGPLPTPIFENDIVPIFEGSCGAGVRDCHSRQVYLPDASDNCRGRMTFENRSLGSTFPFGSPNAGQPTGCPDRRLLPRLLELDVAQCAEPTRYVVPCDTDQSYVARKIVGASLCLSNGMPTAQMPLGTALPPEKFDTMLRWIAAGAPSLTTPSPCPP